jgi:hypothetical protein
MQSARERAFRRYYAGKKAGQAVQPDESRLSGLESPTYVTIFLAGLIVRGLKEKPQLASGDTR